MAAPATPTGFVAQQGNGAVYLTWNMSAGATSYEVFRSVDGITFASVGTSVAPSYSDTTVAVQTKYWYKVTAIQAADSSPQSQAQIVIPVLTGQVSLYDLRLQAQQRADRVGSNFVGLAEWNQYLNQSATELYDLLITVYEDYAFVGPYQITTDGTSQFYDLPNGSPAHLMPDSSIAPAFYKLLGADLSMNTSNNARVTLHKFDFIQRNRYVYPSITNTFLGVFNVKYRILGTTIQFIPTPSAGQVLQLWYVPRLRTMLADTDVLESISGWSEYVIVDAAIKALQKEESDCTLLLAQKQMLKDRIESSAMNRDAGQPDTISPTRRYGGYNWGGGNNDDGTSGGN